ncbi:MAG: helix-turn-helix domain-containing protein [Oscillospiraceae bacterium]|nr:helix-turn-helix domain-containing protein [Oscillospiraceae bacterium]
MGRIKQDISIGRNLRNLRNSQKLTQEQVATKLQLLGCDITRSYYSRYETGELNIKVSELIALTKIFKCQYNDFFIGLDKSN